MQDNQKTLILLLRTWTNDIGGIYDYSTKAVKVIKDNVERTPFILTNEKKFKNNIYSNNNLEKLLKINEEKKNDSFHIIYIKKPNRSFMTKICQYKNHKHKKDRLFKKLNSSSAINDKKNPKSCRLTPVSTISKPIMHTP